MIGREMGDDDPVADRIGRQRNKNNEQRAEQQREEQLQDVWHVAIVEPLQASARHTVNYFIPSAM